MTTRDWNGQRTARNTPNNGTINHCLWDPAQAECQNALPPGQAPLIGAGLRAALRDASQKITTLNGRLDALATVTLYRENQILRAALDHRTQLAPLHGKERH